MATRPRGAQTMPLPTARIRHHRAAFKTVLRAQPSIPLLAAPPRRVVRLPSLAVHAVPWAVPWVAVAEVASQEAAAVAEEVADKTET